MLRATSSAEACISSARLEAQVAQAETMLDGGEIAARHCAVYSIFTSMKVTASRQRSPVRPVDVKPTLRKADESSANCAEGGHPAYRLKPASPAVPAASAKEENKNNNDETYLGIHGDGSVC